MHAELQQIEEDPIPEATETVESSPAAAIMAAGSQNSTTAVPPSQETRCAIDSVRCEANLCCSRNNYCGDTSEFCSFSLGCQTLHGVCWTSDSLSSSGRVGISLAAVFVFVCILIAALWFRVRMRKSAKRYSFSDISAATDGFSEANKLGYGEVYKGTINGRDIAVKKLQKLRSNCRKTSSADMRAFEAEAENISARLNHKNLVAVIGFCVKNNDRFLVCEYLPNGPLSNWLFASEVRNGDKYSPLDWAKRFSIAKGIAEGLYYIHHSLNGCKRIVHGDIKPDNVLLDGDLTPKLADCGLGKLVVNDKADLEEGKAASQGGTRGYCAPEAVLAKHEHYKADVYSFGIVLLEIVSGRRVFGSATELESECYYLPLLAVQCFDNEPEDLSFVLDKALDLGPKEKHQVRRVLCVALWCLQEPKYRPNMNVVLDLLKGNTVDAKAHYEELPPNLPRMRDMFEGQQRAFFGQGHRFRCTYT